MQGVITRVQVLAHPVVVFESFGLKVLLRRARFERFFVISQKHLAYCTKHVQALRARYGDGTARSA